MNRTSTNNDIVKYIYNELEERETLKLNFKGLTEPRIYNEISSFLDIKSHLDLCFETPSDIIINAITIIAGIKTIILMMKSANHFAKLDKFCRADVNESFIFQDSPVIGTCSFKFKFISDVSVVFER